jgi:uncharacterized membrane protein
MSIKKQYQYLGEVKLFLLILLLLLGCYFRFTNLATKIFWVDEIATIVRASGYTISEVINSLKTQDIVGFNDLIAYQKVTANQSFLDTWSALIKSPEHAPLYFILTRAWMQSWGNSITVIRSLSAIFSLLIFPALYWLCQELFNQPSVSCTALMLMSVSPFYAAYAQEARPYSLWTVAILLTSASLLRAIRLNSQSSWWLYSINLMLGLYTSLFSIYVAIFHGIYILLIPLETKIKLFKQYILFSLISLLAFSPWILIIINHLDLLQKNTSWMRGNFNLTEIIAVFIGTILLIFGDLPISENSDPVQTTIILIIVIVSFLAIIILSRFFKQKPIKFALCFAISSSIFLLSNYITSDLVSVVGGLVALAILSLSGYSLYYLINKINRDRVCFILCLMLSVPLSLLIVDIINQGQSSTAPRYLITLQLGIQIAVAYTIANKLSLPKTKKLWQLIFAGFLILGIFSCIRNLNLSPFYQKGRNINNPAIALIINHSNSPLVIVESTDAIDILSLAYSLSPRTKYKIITSGENISKYLNQFTDIFILKPSLKLQDELQQNDKINLQQVYKSHLFSANEIPLDLWQISPITK